MIAGYPWFADWGRDTFISLPGLLLSTGRFSQARQVLKKLLSGPIQFTAHRENGARWYAFRAPIAVGRIINGLACANMVASPTGFEPVFWP